MNEDTRVAVCCYNGDQQCVIQALGNYLQHECPIVILSPEDSRVEIRHPGVENRFAGKRAYVGQDSLDRQTLHFQELLKFPEQYFLIHDSDSICLSSRLPEGLYKEPDLVWANVVRDPHSEHDAAMPAGWPRVALQPPYFLSRSTIERLLSASKAVEMNLVMPFIDYYMLQLSMASGVPFRGFPGGAVCETQTPAGVECMSNSVRTQGNIFLHSIKRPEVYQRLLEDRKEYLRTHSS